ncbi:uncharacterized protein [Venturia canescens]|uniref:uncharacterized protein n=1 Tax=Venturia canescens TaxID=32260 RepID=UPI001C9D514C|nr:uncharacterized protein LOC122406544 [Venturia canescens]
MSLSLEDVAVVCYFTTSLGNPGNREILRLSAKFGEETFATWIKPSKPVSPEIARSMPRFKFTESGMFLDRIKLSTVSMETALKMFYVFLKFIPKPALLVTFTSEYESMLLLRFIEKKGMLYRFRKVIAGFSNTLPLFRQFLPNQDMTLSNLTMRLLNRRYSNQWPEASYALDCLNQLVFSQLFVAELIRIRVPLPMRAPFLSDAQQAHGKKVQNNARVNPADTFRDRFE